MPVGQTPRHELPVVTIFYAEGDTLTLEIADFQGTDISSWDITCDVYQDATEVTTLSKSNGDFNVKGTDSDILEITLSSSQTSDEFSLDEDEGDATEYEGIIQAENADLKVEPYRFLKLELKPDKYDEED